LPVQITKANQFGVLGFLVLAARHKKIKNQNTKTRGNG